MQTDTNDLRKVDINRIEIDKVVRCLAGRLHARLPHGCGIEKSDLIQAGNVGWLQAAQSFEAGRGAPLAGYAKFRIRGEMLDMVRRSAGRGRWQAPAPTSEHVPGWEAQLPASPESSPQHSAAGWQRARIIGEEVRRLPVRYRTVVRLRYSFEMTLRQIGAELRVNESRACQIHQSALNRLRQALSMRGVKALSHL
ncbi:MAG: sigma-70 family RNA polymerase sigma factor [Bryobacteraceae bacterium]